MLIWQGFWIVFVLVLVIALLNGFIGHFKAEKKLFYSLFLLLVLFTAGFSLRLSSNSDVVDLGFFFTEMSQFFTTVLFTAALILGQIRYWRITQQSPRQG